MSDKQKKNLIMAIAFLQLVAAVAIMVLGNLNKTMTSLQGNILVGVSMFIYWLLTDVVDAFVRHRLEGISSERRDAFVRFALLDFAGLAGIAVFLFSMGGQSSYSLIGAAIYAFTVKPKRESQAVFYGEKKIGEDGEENAGESGEAPEKDGKVPEEKEESGQE